MDSRLNYPPNKSWQGAISPAAAIFQAAAAASPQRNCTSLHKVQSLQFRTGDIIGFRTVSLSHRIEKFLFCVAAAKSNKYNISAYFGFITGVQVQQNKHKVLKIVSKLPLRKFQNYRRHILKFFSWLCLIKKEDVSVLVFGRSSLLANLITDKYSRFNFLFRILKETVPGPRQLNLIKDPLIAWAPHTHQKSNFLPHHTLT